MLAGGERQRLGCGLCVLQMWIVRADALFRMRSLRTLSRKSRDFSVEIADYPQRDEKILRNFDFVLPKFHFILPKFHFPVPWGKFVCSLEFSDFLGRNWTQRRCKSRGKVRL